MNKVIINALSVHEKQTGLGVYTTELIKGLLRVSSDCDFTVLASSPVFGEMDGCRVIPVSKSLTPDSSRGNLLRYLWLNSILPLKSFSLKPDVFFSTVAEGTLLPGLNQVITIPDVIPLRYPEYHPKSRYYYAHYVPQLLRNSRAVICISKQTKEDIIYFYKIRHIPVYVIHAGVNRAFFFPRDKEGVIEKLGLGKGSRYVLYIGDLRPYKNLLRSLEAFALLDLPDMYFVIGGNRESRFYLGLEKKIWELKLNHRVVFMGYVQDEDLPLLYSGAEALVFPTLYEGFGLPPLEAMACGCPVVASRVASLPEVCGDAARYVDPYNVESIAEGISMVLLDRGLREKLIREGIERARMFTWEQSAQKHIGVFQEVING